MRCRSYALFRVTSTINLSAALRGLRRARQRGRVRHSPQRESAIESIGHASAHRKRTRVKKGRAGLPARLSSRSGFAKGERGTSHSEAFNGANENAFSHKKSPAERTGGKAGTITLGSVDYARNNVPRGGPRCRRLLPVVSKEAAVFM